MYNTAIGTYVQKPAPKTEELENAAKYAVADLEGILPDYEPSGERTHPGWKTVKELKAALKNISKMG